jgi:hypothetical protein
MDRGRIRREAFLEGQWDYDRLATNDGELTDTQYFSGNIALSIDVLNADEVVGISTFRVSILR